MTTLEEISKLNYDDSWNFSLDMLNIDIGNYTFTDVVETHPFIYLYTNKEKPNIALRYNQDRNCVLLYVLNEDNTVKVTSWCSGNNKRVDIVSKERFEKLFKRYGKK